MQKPPQVEFFEHEKVKKREIKKKFYFFLFFFIFRKNFEKILRFFFDF